VHRNNIPIYIQQDVTLHSSFYLETALHVSGWYHHPSSGAQTTVSTAFGICDAVIAICHSSTTVADSSNGLTSTRCFRHSCLRSWWWVVLPPETCRAVCRWNKLCNSWDLL